MNKVLLVLEVVNEHDYKHSYRMNVSVDAAIIHSQERYDYLKEKWCEALGKLFGFKCKIVLLNVINASVE